MFSRKHLLLLIVVAACVISGPAGAQPEKSAEAPQFTVMDINGQQVDLAQLTAKNPDLIIIAFFEVETGAQVAAKLQSLNTLYGQDQKLEIIAVGYREDEEALRGFANRYGLKYYIVGDQPTSEVTEKYGPVSVLPKTFLVTNQREILRVVEGSGESEIAILNHVAKAYLQQKKAEQAKAAANLAVEAGENEQEARSITGYASVIEGKLDEAEAEFGKIDSKEGLAKVALERGDLERARQLADEAGTGYAQTVKGVALLREGKLDEAEQTVDEAAGKEADDWQKSETLNIQGRIAQEAGKNDAAVERYQEAIALDPYNVVALSNEGSVYRKQGDLQKAAEVLEEAQKTGVTDDMTALMLKQVRDELEKANDTQRRELIRQQITDLKAAYEKQQAEGTAEPADPWTSRPLVMAFLPAENRGPVFFERAGTDIVIRRELESRLQDHPRVQIVEREMLDQLLQELNLGASDLADPNTQLRLGKVLSAQLLGFVEFAQNAGDTTMYLRLVDTETTQIDTQISKDLEPDGNVEQFVSGTVDELLNKAVAKRRLQGLVAEATADEVIINLGAQHGVQPGMQFEVLKEGKPIQAAGRVLGNRILKVGIIEAADVQDEFSVCTVVSKREGEEIAAEMKVKEAAGK